MIEIKQYKKVYITSIYEMQISAHLTTHSAKS